MTAKMIGAPGIFRFLPHAPTLQPVLIDGLGAYGMVSILVA